jgi:DNA-binding MarR family transcriptional regulator
VHTNDEEQLSPAVLAARDQLQNPRLLSERIAIGRALWRELVIGFSAQLHELGLGFTQLAALYAIGGTQTLTIADLAEQVGRSPSATSRIVDGLVRRGLVRRAEEVADRRQRTLELSDDGRGLLAHVDRARAEEFLDIVRPLPPAERALIAMGVAALSSRALTRRGRLIRSPAGTPRS